MQEDEKDKIADDSQLIETCLDRSVVYQGGFFNVSKDKVRLPNGAIGEREYIKHPGAVVILPLFEDQTVLLERQFRYPLNRVFIEFPAGKIEAGEDHLDCAKRELEEETGYCADTWQYLTTIHNAIGYSNESIDVYLATHLHAGKTHLDDEEFIYSFRMPVKKLLEMIRNSEISDVKTVIGAFWLEKIINNQWKLQKNRP